MGVEKKRTGRGSQQAWPAQSIEHQALNGRGQGSSPCPGTQLLSARSQIIPGGVQSHVWEREAETCAPCSVAGILVAQTQGRLLYSEVLTWRLPGGCLTPAPTPVQSLAMPPYFFLSPVLPHA